MDKLTRLPAGKKRTHGGYSFLATGRLPEHRREVERYLTAGREGLIRDIAGIEENLSTAQVILIDRAIGKLGLLRCMEEHVRETGAFKGEELAPALRKSYLSYSNSLRLDLQALGIDKRPADEPSLADIIREFDEDKVRAADQGNQAGEGEKIDPGRPEPHVGAKEGEGTKGES